MTREEIVKALRCFASEDYCPFDECNKKCPYWMEIDKYDIDNPNAEISDVHQLCRAAADMLEADEKELLEKQVEAVKAADVMPIMTAFHERCMELEIERRILLEQTHKKTVAEVCGLRDQVHNLTLYLTEALALCPEDLKVLEDWHPGLPGYAPESEEACAACRVEGNA